MSATGGGASSPAGVVLFTVSSAAGALAPNAGTLIAARAIEGIGGAVIMPLTLTMMTAAFPAERRGAALGIWSAISGFGVALGPVAGGLLTDALSWHWIFWVNVPIGIAVALGRARACSRRAAGRFERLDLTGVVLVSGGLLGVVYATVRGQRRRLGLGRRRCSPTPPAPRCSPASCGGSAAPRTR